MCIRIKLSAPLFVKCFCEWIKTHERFSVCRTKHVLSFVFLPGATFLKYVLHHISVVKCLVIGLICDTQTEKKAMVWSLPGDTPPVCAHALNKRSGIDWGLAVLINLTSIYKAIGWITRDASLHTQPRPEGRGPRCEGERRRGTAAGPGRGQARPLCRLSRGARSNRVPWLPSRGILWKRHDPRVCVSPNCLLPCQEKRKMSAWHEFGATSVPSRVYYKWFSPHQWHQ